VREDPGSGRPIQCVTKYEPRQTSWLVFIIYPPILTEVANLTTRTKRQCETTTTPETPMTPETTTTPLPSPLCPNASRRWTFQRFQRRFHCFHPPSHPNASRRWTFLAFQHVCHYHHLPRVQMRAGGGPFDDFNATATASTSLASKREPEVDFFGILTPPPPSEGILPAASTTTGRCETHTPPRSNVFSALRGS
jgi:hypothetical protein